MTPPGGPALPGSPAALRIADAGSALGVPESQDPHSDANAPGPFARRVREQIGRRVRRLEKCAGRVRRGAGGDSIKELRIACRRLEAALRLWKPFLATGEGRRARRRLRALRRAFGPVREQDLHATLLRALPGEVPEAARQAAIALAGNLERRTRRRLVALASRVRAKRVRALTGCVTAAARGIRRRVARRGDPLAPARRRLGRFEEAIAAGLAEAPRSGDPAALHALRLRVKKARYSCESLGESLGLAFALDPLVALQQTLGQLHDRHTLIARVRKRIARAGKRGDAATAPTLEGLCAFLESEYAARLSVLRREAAAGALRIRMPSGSSVSGEDPASATQAG